MISQLMNKVMKLVLLTLSMISNDVMHSNQTKNRIRKYNKAVEIRNNSTLSTEELSEKYQII